MTEQKNKGGRPTRAQQAAKGITKTEMDVAIRILKKYFGPAIEEMLRIANDNKLPLDKQFRMHQDIVRLYMDVLKTDKAFAAAERAKGEETPPAIEPTGVVFQLAK